MSYDKFISSLNDEDDSRIYKEDIGLWLSLSASEKAKMIRETKELGTEEDVKYLLEVAEEVKTIPNEEKPGLISKFKTFVSKAKSDYADAKEKTIDPLLKTTGSIGKGMEYTGKKLGIKALARRGAAAQDSAMAGTISRKLGASADTAEKVGETVGKGSEAIRKFASEHGGKAAAAAAAGLGALGLVKAIRRKKEQTPAPSAV